MTNTFFPKAAFRKEFAAEMSSAVSTYQRRKQSGMLDNSLARYDFVFISDQESKLTQLSKFLVEQYGCKLNEPKQINDVWEMSGDANEFPVDEENLVYWVLDLYCKGHNFDCKLDGYGAIGDPTNQHFPDIESLDAGYYFDLAMDAYNKQDLGMAFIHFSTAIKIDATNPNSWYSRAIVRDELHTWKSARRDFDKAIELAPDFVDAIINRAANKDEAGEYAEAIADYDKAIILNPENEMAYFNRGNSKLNINDKKGACEDWHKAKDLGAEYAQARIDEHCPKNTFLSKAKSFFGR